MNEDNKLPTILNEIDNWDLTSLDCLEISRKLLLINPKLIKDYPSLEDAITTLNQVILSELD